MSASGPARLTVTHDAGIEGPGLGEGGKRGCKKQEESSQAERLPGWAAGRRMEEYEFHVEHFLSGQAQALVCKFRVKVGAGVMDLARAEHDVVQVTEIIQRDRVEAAGEKEVHGITGRNKENCERAQSPKWEMSDQGRVKKDGDQGTRAGPVSLKDAAGRVGEGAAEPGTKKGTSMWDNRSVTFFSFWYWGSSPGPWH